MANIEREIADEILRAGHNHASKLGLRFDRVVVGVLGELRAFAEAAAPVGVTLIVTLSAPIRSPAKTVDDLKREMVALFAREAFLGDHSLHTHGNNVRVRLVDHSPSQIRLIGFVHNSDAPATPILDLAEQWLRGKA